MLILKSCQFGGKRIYIMNSGVYPGKASLVQFFKSINVFHHINSLKKENHMIIAIDAEKAFVTCQHPFMTKTLSGIGEGNSSN